MTEDGTETVINLHVDEDYGELTVAERAQVASATAYVPVYLSAPEAPALAGRLTIPERGWWRACHPLTTG